MKKNRKTFKAADGLSLAEQSWQPKRESKAVVVILHGFAEYSDCYDHLALHLVHNLYAVYAFDLRGHGRSEGERGFVHSFDEYLSDLKCFIERVISREPGKPIFVFAHSMGGTIATLSVVKNQINISGLILTSLLLKVPDNVSPILPKFARILSALFPKLPIKTIDSSLISRNPKAVKRYDNDPLIYRGSMSARIIAEVNKAMESIQAGMETISLPLLILHGGADTLVDVSSSKLLYDRAKSEDKTLKLYKPCFHALIAEPEKMQIIIDIIKWLNNHI